MNVADPLRLEAGAAPRELDALLGRYPAARPPATIAGAAVTIVLRDDRSEVETLLIERASNPRDPASGHVAFPGGGVEESDRSLATTALRELEEEVGLGPEDLAGPPRFVGTLYASRFRLEVGVFAARLGSGARRPTPRSPDEVAQVFWLPRSALASTREVPRETGLGPATVRATVFDGHVLWGFTRRVLRQFFELPVEEDWVGAGPDGSRSRPS